MPTPGGRRHWPDQSGYFDSSWAEAAAFATISAAPITIEVSKRAQLMLSSWCKCRAAGLIRNKAPRLASRHLTGKLDHHFADCLKWRKSGGGWSFCDGINWPSPLKK